VGVRVGIGIKIYNYTKKNEKKYQYIFQKCGQLLAFIPTDGHGQINWTIELDQEYMYIHTLYGRKRFLLPVCYTLINETSMYTLL